MTVAVPRELGLIRRGNIWSYRRRVPKDLVAALDGKRELKKSLKTESYREAKVRRNRQAKIWDDLFVRLRRESSGGPANRRLANFHLAEIECLIDRYVAAQSAEELEQIRSTDWASERPSDIPSELDDFKYETASLIKVLKEPAEYHTQQAVTAAYERLFEGKDVLSGLPDTDQTYVWDLLRRALLEIERRNAAWLSHRYTTRSFDPAFTQPQGEIIRLQQVAEEYLTEYDTTRAGVGGKRKQMLRAAADLVIDFFGADINVAHIDQKHCRQFRDFLNAAPANMRKHFPDRSMQLADIIAATRQRDLPRMKRNTQKKYIDALQRLLDWARRNDYTSSNPAQDIQALGEHTPAKRAREAWEIDDLRKIFATLPFGSCPDKTSHRFWVPLIAAFTGMRANEICQLDISDIKTSSPSGVPYIEVVGDNETKRVKNTRSERRIPIHSELIKVGFLDFVGQQAALGKDGKLFKELRRSRHGYYVEDFSKWANRTFFKAAGVKAPKKNVHSFRHTVKDALERAATPIHVIDAIGGWNTVVRGASVNYGNGPTVEDLAPYVEGIRYPGLDLSHLYERNLARP